MMYPDTIIDILKWTVLVFAAGFIGFFGKSVARVILTFFGKDRQAEASGPVQSREEKNGPESASEPVPSGDAVAKGPLPDADKLGKKREKARLKQEKKLAKKAPREGQ